MNILQKDPLLVPQPTAALYAVYNGQDYHITLATLIRLVTATTIGLERVDNTGDDEKPVSVPQQQALDLKADKTNAVTPAQLTALANSLQGYVTLEQLNTAINAINQANSGYLTSAQANQLIATALIPINTAINTVAQNLAIQTGRIDTLIQMGQSNSYASQADLNALAQTVNALSSALSSLRTAFESHSHTMADITGAETYINNVVDAKVANAVTNGPHDW